LKVICVLYDYWFAIYILECNGFFILGFVFVFLMSGKTLVGRVMGSGTLPDKIPRNVYIVVTGGDCDSRAEVISALRVKYHRRKTVIDGSNGGHKNNGKREYGISLEQF
jgi:hypothetical protein